MAAGSGKLRADDWGVPSPEIIAGPAIPTLPELEQNCPSRDREPGRTTTSGLRNRTGPGPHREAAVLLARARPRLRSDLTVVTHPNPLEISGVPSVDALSNTTMRRGASDPSRFASDSRQRATVPELLNVVITTDASTGISPMRVRV